MQTRCAPSSMTGSQEKKTNTRFCVLRSSPQKGRRAAAGHGPGARRRRNSVCGLGQVVERSGLCRDRNGHLRKRPFKRIRRARRARQPATPRFFGPPDWNAAFEQLDWPVEDQWTYHAVADILLANCLLRSFPEIDPGRIGITGISRDGYCQALPLASTGGIALQFRFTGADFLARTRTGCRNLRRWAAENRADGLGCGILRCIWVERKCPFSGSQGQMISRTRWTRCKSLVVYPAQPEHGNPRPHGARSEGGGDAGGDQRAC